MAPKMTHVYAAAAGIVTVIDTHGSAAGTSRSSTRPDGRRYLHLNNDDPGTDNGRADWSLTLVQGLEVGSHVEAASTSAMSVTPGTPSGPGLTAFRARPRRREVDPYPVLKDAYARAIALRAAAIRRVDEIGEAKPT